MKHFFFKKDVILRVIKRSYVVKSHFTLEKPRKKSWRQISVKFKGLHSTSGNEFKYKQMESERTTFDRKGHLQRRITY